jgi:hypothetical protein
MKRINAFPAYPPVALRLPPRFDTPSWGAISEEILEDAHVFTRAISRRRWIVVHPHDSELRAALLSNNTSQLRGGSFERVRTLEWKHARDGISYILAEYPALLRQPPSFAPTLKIAEKTQVKSQQLHTGGKS